MSTRSNDLPERQARLKDGRSVRVRHGSAGDEAGIAALIAAAFPVYERAARGDPERAARSFARELRPHEFVVAALADTGQLVGVSCISGRGQAGLSLVARIRTKLECWSVHGLLCFLLEKIRRRLFESAHRARPGELYRYLDAVDVHYRSLGVARHIADFVDDYGRAAGYHTVSAKHRSDNHPVLALHRKRGCALIERPPTLLARSFRYPHMAISTRVLSAPAGPPGLLGAADAS
ncbi:MAG: GNAT family N-acetyltransferase [Myxococcota bacterium]